MAGKRSNHSVPPKQQIEEDLDHLLIESTAEHSLHPTDRSYDPSSLEKMLHKQWLLKYAAAAVVFFIAVGGGVWYIMGRSSAREAAEARAAAHDAQLQGLALEITHEVRGLLSENKIDDAIFALQKGREKGLPNQAYVDIDKGIKLALTENTTREIKSLLSKHKYADANSALRKAIDWGLPGPVQVELREEITTSMRPYYEDLLDQAEESINKKSLSAAKDSVAKAESMSFHASGNRIYTLRENLQKLERELERTQGEDLIAQSRAAAEDKSWDTSISLLEQAREFPELGQAVFQWEQELRKRVGGRLRVEGSPKHARILFPEQSHAKMGDILHGLTPGTVELTVEAEGHVPDVVRVEVDFPEIAVATIDLIRESPGPIWAAHALTDHCGQELVVDYYRLQSKHKKWKKVLKALAKPCQTNKKEKKLSKKKLANAVTKAVNDFQNSKSGFVAALDELGEFAARHPGAMKRLLRNDEYIRAIGEGLRQVETGCSDCIGQGKIPCAECSGRGKRREMRPCDACSAQGQKTHITCKGTGKIKCKICKGRGYSTKREQVREGDRWIKKRVRHSCNRCNGTGAATCLKCQNGRITCTKCKGTTRSKNLGECSTCKGAGGHPCEVCNSTGERRKMKLKNRRKTEQRLALIMKEDT